MFEYPKKKISSLNQMYSELFFFLSSSSSHISDGVLSRKLSLLFIPYGSHIVGRSNSERGRKKDR